MSFLTARRKELNETKPEHAESDGLMKFVEGSTLARSDSMDITNDPRFFTDNVINYRLAAFNGLAVVSGFMIGNAMGQVFDMNKKLELWHERSGTIDIDGVLLSICFLMLVYINFAMILSTFIGVVQPYHTLRLMTAGPRGFETAAAYYLEPQIVAYRHLTIKMMLSSLPLYLVQMGLRLQTKFELYTVAHDELPQSTPFWSQVQGIIFATIHALMGSVLIYLHCTHQDVFRRQYDDISKPLFDMQNYMNSVMAPRAMGTNQGEAFTSWFGATGGPDV